jgi:hypothetical protein
MTATIRPPLDAPGVARLDPEVRLRDYESALSFYLEHLDHGVDLICFAENSGSDMASLRALVASRGACDRVLFTDQSGLGFPPVYGRCYGETALLDRAMVELGKRPRLEDAVFWKVTGRYKVLNLRRMIRARPKAADLYIDLRARRAQCWADLRLMSWTSKGYDSVMRGIAPLIREDTHKFRPGEETAYHVLKERIAKAEISAVTSFASEPLIDGVRAFDERNWMGGRQRAVFYARSLQRAVFGRVIV